MDRLTYRTKLELVLKALGSTDPQEIDWLISDEGFDTLISLCKITHTIVQNQELDMETVVEEYNKKSIDE